MRDHLSELSGNELKVWMYYFLRTGEELTSFPSNKLVAQEIGLNPDTVKTCKASLRRKGWQTKEYQRVREDGTFSTVVEKILLPWGKTSTTETENPHHGTVVEKTDDGKFHQRKEYTENLEGSVPSEPYTEHLEEGQLASQLVSSASASPRLSPSEKQKQQTSSSLPAKQDQKQNQTDPYTEQIANDIGCDGTIPALLGFPYFHDGHDPELQVMAEVLIQRNRSLHWLVDLVVWMKEHKFWSKRIHTGDRGVKQLAKHLSNGELVEQFESHLVLKHRCGMMELPAYLLRTREQILAAYAASKAASAASSEPACRTAADYAWGQPSGGGFDVEEAE